MNGRSTDDERRMVRGGEVKVTARIRRTVFEYRMSERRVKDAPSLALPQMPKNMEFGEGESHISEPLQPGMYERSTNEESGEYRNS